MSPEKQFTEDISNLDFTEVIEAVERLASQLHYEGKEKVAPTNVRISIFLYAMDEYFKFAPATIEEAVFIAAEAGTAFERMARRTALRKFSPEKLALETIRQMLR